MKKINVEDGMPTRRIDFAGSQNQTTVILDDKRTRPKGYSSATSPDESKSCLYYTRCKEKRSRCHFSCRFHLSPTQPAHKQRHSKSAFRVLVPANEWYGKAVDYPSYRLIHKSQR